LSGVICAGNYNNKLIKKSLINFKYNSLITLNNPLSTYLCRFLDNHLSLLSFKKEKDFLFFFSTCCLCFIPLHNKRKRLRGFNQTELLAKKIAEYFKLPLTDKLEKIHFTKPQAQLNELERRQNLNDSFIFKGQAPKNILLVDDVTTTGTSLQKAAEALRKAGAQKIWGLTIARG
nr:hypothetical protein [Planctomycetota bacterium]